MKDILEELINDVRNMSIEEYNAYHKEALVMKKAYDEMLLQTTLYQYSTAIISAIFEELNKSLTDISTQGPYFETTLNNDNNEETLEWQTAA